MKYVNANKTVTLNLRVSDYGNRVLGVVKEKFGLKDKSEALGKMLDMYGDEYVDKEVREDVIKEMMAEVEKMELSSRKAISLKELDKLCGLK